MRAYSNVEVCNRWISSSVLDRNNISVHASGTDAHCEPTAKDEQRGPERTRSSAHSRACSASARSLCQLLSRTGTEGDSCLFLLLFVFKQWWYHLSGHIIVTDKLCRLASWVLFNILSFRLLLFQFMNIADDLLLRRCLQRTSSTWSGEKCGRCGCGSWTTSRLPGVWNAQSQEMLFPRSRWGRRDVGHGFRAPRKIVSQIRVSFWVTKLNERWW